MSVETTKSLPLSLRREPFALNDTRGTLAISLFIATEGTLFAVLFATYWYVAELAPRWPPDPPPKLHYAIPMLVILLLSSAILHWGEGQIQKRPRFATLAVVVTILMGIGFLIFSTFEYGERLQTLSPTQDTYGSLFYTIVTLHAAHVVVGLCMLCFVLLLPSFEPRHDMPHRPYHNAALYWHFVDTVWIFVVLILYVIPNLR